MKNKDIFKVLIPILAVVIIVESILVVSRLDRSKPVDVIIPEVDDELTEEIVELRQIEGKASFVFSVEDQNIEVGDKKRVTLEILPKEDFNLDAMDLYVSYSADSLEVSGLLEESGLKATSKRVSDKTGVVLANFWFMEEGGYKFEAGKSVKLMSFMVEPETAGVYELSMVESGDEVTKLVSSIGDEVVTYGFSSEKLIINAEN